MLLDHIGRPQDALRVEQAVASDLLTRGTATRSTSQVGDAIAALAG
jgi:3-isopropylmalate dehydrogenase